MPGKHSKFAPSAAHRWIECPGSIELNERYPDESSSFADEGTFAHWIAERCLRSGDDAAKMIGETDLEFTVDEEMAEHIQVYLDAVRAKIPDTDDPVFWVEGKVKLDGLPYDCGGTADALVLSEDEKELDVFDLKYGAGVLVDSKHNPQLRIYGVAALLTFPALLANVKKIRLNVVQPRHARGGHTWELLSRDELLLWAQNTLVPALKEAEEGGTKLSAGEHCRFCKAKAECPEIRRASLDAAADVFDDANAMKPAKTPPDPAQLTPAKLGEILSVFPLIEQWMKAVREHAYAEANRGVEVPGFKLVETVGHRKWVDEESTELVLETLVPKGASIYAKPKLLSPAQAEKLVPKKDREKVSALAFKPATGTALVPVSDKRDAVVRGDVFGSSPVK